MKSQTITTDVLILGSGSAGIAAAVAAASEGATVVVVDENIQPGGRATHAEVGTICGLYHFGATLPPRFITNGFARDFSSQIASKSNSKAVSQPNGLHYLPYRIDAFREHSAKLLSRSNIRQLRGTRLDAVEIGMNRVQAIRCLSNDQESIVEAKEFVDCSGYSLLSMQGHLPLIDSTSFQAAAQVFTLSGLENLDEPRMGLLLHKLIRNGINQGILPAHSDWFYPVQGSIFGDQASFKLGIPLDVTLTTDNCKQLRENALSTITAITTYLKGTADVLKNLELMSVAPQLGIRVGRRPEGKYVLEENDVLGCRKFDHAIANGSWPIEEWGLDKRVKMQYLPENNYYQIPAESLQSNSVENLFFAGSCISASDKAIASARVIGTCLQTGYAAGMMAAGAVHGVDILKTISKIQSLQTFTE